MRYSAEHKQRTRDAILGAAGRLFRAEGYGGSGIDGLTKAAGVTNGAFYGHFKTKADAFAEIVKLALTTVRERIAAAQAAYGDGWAPFFIDYYLAQNRESALCEACPLVMLTAEVARAGETARRNYETAFDAMIDTMAAGLDGDRNRALALTSILAGSGAFRRTLSDPALCAELEATVREAALRIAAKPQPRG